MNVENTSTEGVTDIIKVEIKVENESDNEVESERDLYTDHVIKEEMVIGPVVLQEVDVTCCIKLKEWYVWGEHNYFRIQNEDEAESSASHIIEWSDVPVPKKPTDEDVARTTDEETDQVKPQKGMKEDNTEGFISNVDDINNCFHVCSYSHTHTDDKPYSCSYCEYKCYRKGHLSLHLRTHTGEKPYSCSYCEYKTSLKRTLISHLRIHTGEKPYSCSYEYCDYKFKDSSGLSKHLRTHTTGEKPFLCSYCDFKCKKSITLSRHLRTHTGYSCSHCDYKCKDSSSLSSHLRIHTPQKPHIHADILRVQKFFERYCKDRR